MKRFFLVLLLWSFNHTIFAGEKIQMLKPANEVLWGIKKLAVVKFEKDTDITGLLEEKLKQTNYFDVLPQVEIDNILQKNELTLDSIRAGDRVQKICNVLAIDGLINGAVTISKVEPDEKGIEQVKKHVWTGKYERDKDGKIIEEVINGELVKKKLFEEKIINQAYTIRRGTVSITFNLFDGKTGLTAISSTITKNFDSGKVPDENIKTLPPAEKILQKLTEKVIAAFVESIAPKVVTVKRNIEAGKDFIDEGKVYATSGLWKEALETWHKAEQAFPNNPAVYYNLGLAYEAQGEYEKAENYYKKAILLKDKKLYKKALKKIRKAWQKKEEKLKKGRK